MPKVTFVNENKDIEVESGVNLREAARQAGVSVFTGLDRYLNCMGFGLCGSCRVLVNKGVENLGPKTFLEKLNLSAHPPAMYVAVGHEIEMRLSCQVKVYGDCSVQTTPECSLTGENFWHKPFPTTTDRG